MSVSKRRLAPEDIRVARTEEECGRAAGEAAAELLKSAIAERGRARVIFASAPSQEQMLHTLTNSPGIDWAVVESLHLDEYRGIASDHPAAFGQWLTDRLPAAALPGLKRIYTGGTSEAEIERYSEIIAAEPIDLVCPGVGVNGHVAFNEPGDTDFDDTRLVREVPLAHASRQQQVDEGLFSKLDNVPTHALSMTVPAILRAASVVCTVLGTSKADAVAAMLTRSISSDLPATSLRTHEHVSIFLDSGAAEKIPSSVPVTTLS